jgi:hypothetical protein
MSEEEFRDLEAVASKRGLTLSEWCREALLASMNGQEQKSATDSPGPDQVALLAELVALRAILLNVLFRQANGQTVTAEEMQGLIDRADSDKISTPPDAASSLSEKKNMEGRHVGLDFYDLLIEA